MNVKSVFQHCHMNGWRCALPEVPLLCQMRYKTSLHIVRLAPSQVGNERWVHNAMASPSGIGIGALGMLIEIFSSLPINVVVCLTKSASGLVLTTLTRFHREWVQLRKSWLLLRSSKSGLVDKLAWSNNSRIRATCSTYSCAYWVLHRVSGVT